MGEGGIKLWNTVGEYEKVYLLYKGVSKGVKNCGYFTIAQKASKQQ